MTRKIKTNTIFFAILLALWATFTPVLTYATPLTEYFDFNFEDFTTGEINGQNGWVADTSGIFTIQETGDVFGKSLKTYWLTESYKSATYDADTVMGGTGEDTIIFYVKAIDGNYMSIFSAQNAGTGTLIYVVFRNQSGTTWRFLDSGGSNIFGTNTVQEGNLIKLTWTINWDTPTSTLYGYNLSTSTDLGSKVFTTYSANLTDISKFKIDNFDAYVVYEGFGLPPPPDASVWGTAPVSGTEITDLEDTMTVEYEGLDDYETLYITLRHPPTGLFTDAKEYDLTELGGSGEIIVNLDDLNIEKNGNWYLHAVAVRQGYQIEQGQFLSGYGWIWSDDLTDGDYYLDINIEGYEEIFAMSDFNSWYDENSKFDAPTEMFGAIAGFFEPIFSKVGEFGSRIENYFDTNTAYSKGFEIGKAIPLFAYYVEQIAVFMGGFPLMNWLLIIILLLVGIFVFRVILKFIPFLGGS